jgi:DNA-directed RNA polymerase subunit RPC12/RpoP
VTKFKCNGCSRDTEFLWLDQTDMPDGFKLYQCMDCGAVGCKNIAEQKDAPKDSKVSRCKSCGAWQFDALPCHTCLLIGEYDAHV